MNFELHGRGQWVRRDGVRNNRSHDLYWRFGFTRLENRSWMLPGSACKRREGSMHLAIVNPAGQDRFGSFPFTVQVVEDYIVCMKRTCHSPRYLIAIALSVFFATSSFAQTEPVRDETFMRIYARL